MPHPVRRALAARISLLLAACVLPLLACGEATAPTRDLRRAAARWAAAGPASYEVTVGVSCFCTPDVTRPVIVRVRDGQVESRRYADTGADVVPQLASLFPTVPALFAIIEDAHSRGAARVDAQFDATLGFPVSVSIDYVANVADDEIWYGMRALHAIP